MTEIDHVIEETRRRRRRMSEQCGHDVRRYLEHLKGFNTRCAAQVERYRKFKAVSQKASATPR